MHKTISQLTAEVTDRFQIRFGCRPAWISCAPGRVNLIGEHVDYNDGYVLPMAIDRYTLVAAAPNRIRQLLVESTSENGLAEIQLDQPPARGQPAWADYLRGVTAGMQRKGFPVTGLDAVVHSSIPLGGGLSSSAALEVSFASILEASAGISMEPLHKALLCQQAEQEFAGMPCGIMDQFASILCQADHLLLIDCRSNKSHAIPFADPTVSVLIINSNVRHELAGSEYGDRRRDCEEAVRLLGVTSLRDVSSEDLLVQKSVFPERNFLRARHAVSEIQRTAQAAESARAGNWLRFGELMYQSHASLRDDYAVSCNELDLLVELARDLGEGGGVFGSRMTGGGFGGCTVSLVSTSLVESISTWICQAYTQQTSIVPTAFVSRPVAGARLLMS